MKVELSINETKEAVVQYIKAQLGEDAKVEEITINVRYGTACAIWNKYDPANEKELEE